MYTRLYTRTWPYRKGVIVLKDLCRHRFDKIRIYHRPNVCRYLQGACFYSVFVASSHQSCLRRAPVLTLVRFQTGIYFFPASFLSHLLALPEFSVNRIGWCVYLPELLIYNVRYIFICTSSSVKPIEFVQTSQ